MTKRELLWRTAYHEAGHAVMAWRYHERILDRGVWIDEAGNGEVDTASIAHTLEFALARHQSAPLRECLVYRAECEVRSLLAGHLAELRYARRRVTGVLYCSDGDLHIEDLNRAKKMLDAITGRQGDHTFYQLSLQRETQRILREPRTWAAASRLARALVLKRRISGERAFEIFRLGRVPTVRRLRVGGLPAFEPQNGTGRGH